ncbi:hypothetical protein SAMN02745181_2435 [Rubritalea squalenifaciens DSM 18772]|uniref:Pyridoxal phosphate homeostasis protein n=1 Tax=Rubritalea squalenifaciens DSM 18772 TaxID=1123071 RepID=A0A1M6LLN7_9BACT|nr:YggS family pyridoxal phosphate-dependent enzyme [Rubritalea squalenifaciens]SHJ72129.1 hypothetical protein SAMN02745181_2435 [Rubritalea squalenifaciens DSM 18772]
MNEVAENLAEVKERMAIAAQSSGRGVDEVSLVAVSKTWPAEHVQQAVDAGQRVFGENKLQEGQDKIPAMSDELEWHFIGGLQRNKVRKVFGLFHWVHSIDSLKLARYANGVATDMGIRPKVLLQVNIGRELSKGGFEVDELEDSFAEILQLEHLDLRGLMCIPPAVENPDDARIYFKEMVALRVRLQEQYGMNLPELSMGMSGDFEVAIQEGATMVRVGSSIFGARNYSR